MIFDDRLCALGEGPLWHPLRQELFWFDILGCRMLSRQGDKTRDWPFDENVSAAGWIDRDTLLVASETGLWRFGLQSGRRDRVASLETGTAETRSNDGRADPWGGFWIGTMGKQMQRGAGAIYRFAAGELRLLVPEVTVANAICFAPDRSCAYFTDTWSRRVMRWALDPAIGWPEGEATVFLDLRSEGLNPDGAVVDAAGNLWLAQWGAGRVAVYGPDGGFRRALAFPARQTSCPAFGGPDLTTLFCTSAREGIDATTLRSEPTNGMTFCALEAGRGQAEHQVRL
jgi:sugar lactone lactonase YvrE